MKQVLSRRFVSATTTAAMLALFGPALAHANTYQYDFTVGWAESPAFGSFTIDIDPSLLPAGGGAVYGKLVPTSFSLEIDGQLIDESTAQIGVLEFDSAGALTYAVFGHNCGHGCVIGGGAPLEWAMAFWPTETPWWHPYKNVSGTITMYGGEPWSPSRYSEQAHVFIGHVTPPTAVPEPQSVALALAGLLLVVGRRMGASKLAVSP